MRERSLLAKQQEVRLCGCEAMRQRKGNGQRGETKHGAPIVESLDKFHDVSSHADPQ